MERLLLLGRHETVPLTRSACRWKSERQAKKVVRRAEADVVVDIRIDAAVDGSEDIHELDLKRCHWVAKACQRASTAYLYVSSSRVFSGELGRPYSELDPPDSDETVAQLLAAGEEAVQEGCERHMILRLGPVFSKEGSNLVTEFLDIIKSGGSLELDNNLRGSPVAAEDGARVVSALLDQLSTGVEPWGTYHYGSSDTASYYEFAEALLASASQFAEFDASAVRLEKLSEESSARNRALDCRKIRDSFAIKQAPWRTAMADIIKQYNTDPEKQEV
jgi:dTDP-4-dehydrorhamnose reductase